MSHTYELLNDSTQTLQDAGLYNMQVCSSEPQSFGALWSFNLLGGCLIVDRLSYVYSLLMRANKLETATVQGSLDRKTFYVSPFQTIVLECQREDGTWPRSTRETSYPANHSTRSQDSITGSAATRWVELWAWLPISSSLSGTVPIHLVLHHIGVEGALFGIAAIPRNPPILAFVDSVI